MHKTVRRFYIEGKIADDSDFGRIRAQYESMLIYNMREKGYVPVLDLTTEWSTQLDDQDNYDFILSVYGVKVGKSRSWEIEGISMGKEVPRTIRQNKLKRF